MPAADTKKADGASMTALRIPRPTSLTGSAACCHCMSDVSQFNIADKAVFIELSISERIGFAWQCDVLRVHNNFGILTLYLSCVSASLDCSSVSRRTALRKASVFSTGATVTYRPGITGDPSSRISSIDIGVKPSKAFSK